MPSKPNLLIIMTDQHRADHAGWDARPRLATPHLNRIAAEARDEPFAGFTPDAETTAALHALRRAYAAMIDGIDEQVGRVLDRLTALGLDNSTMVAFTADHGEMPGATNPGPGRWWRSGSGSMSAIIVTTAWRAKPDMTNGFGTCPVIPTSAGTAAATRIRRCRRCCGACATVATAR